MTVHAIKPEEFLIEDEPSYEPVGDELTVFQATNNNHLPMENLGQIIEASPEYCMAISCIPDYQSVTL